jgi:hypothetical protein
MRDAGVLHQIGPSHPNFTHEIAYTAICDYRHEEVSVVDADLILTRLSARSPK